MGLHMIDEGDDQELPQQAEQEPDAPEQEVLPPQVPAKTHRGTLRKFSKRMVADFANSWLIHGEEAIEKLRKENIQAYVKTAVSLIPREILLSVSKAASEMSDRELLQAAAAEKEQATLLIDHIRLMGPEEETILLQAQREVLGAALNPDDDAEDDDDNG